MTRRLIVLALLVPFASVFAAPAAHAGGFCTYEPITDRVGNEVDMKGNCFFPMVVRVDKGEEVTWTNYDVETHTVTAPGSWSSGHKEYKRMDTESFRFKDEGVYPYLCLYHPGMVGAVVVGDGAGPALEEGAAGVSGSTSSDVGTSADEPAEAGVPATTPARATNDEGISTLAIGALAVGAAMGLFILSTWLRRRATGHRGDAIA
jgi:plastocyanin